MEASIELSMYPLGREYKPEIKAFVKRLKEIEGIEVQVNGMSTQIFGDYRHLMQIITEEIEGVFKQDNKSVFVMKLINGTMKKEQ